MRTVSEMKWTMNVQWCLAENPYRSMLWVYVDSERSAGPYPTAFNGQQVADLPMFKSPYQGDMAFQNGQPSTEGFT